MSQNVFCSALVHGKCLLKVCFFVLSCSHKVAQRVPAFSHLQVAKATDGISCLGIEALASMPRLCAPNW